MSGDDLDLEPWHFTPLEWLKIVGAAVALIVVGYVLILWAATLAPAPEPTTPTQPVTTITQP